MEHTGQYKAAAHEGIHAIASGFTPLGNVRAGL